MISKFESFAMGTIHLVGRSISAIFRLFGYYRCDYGFSCGRAWVTIDGRTICQTPRDDLWMADEDVCDLAYVMFDRGKHMKEPVRLRLRHKHWEMQDRECANCGELFRYHHHDLSYEDTDYEKLAATALCPLFDQARRARGFSNKTSFKHNTSA